MTEYTPTTEQIAHAYEEHTVSWTGASREKVLTHFDRWLGAHDAEVAANALREAVVEIEAVLVRSGHLMTSSSRTGYYESRDILAARADRIEREATNHKPNPEEDPRG